MAENTNGKTQREKDEEKEKSTGFFGKIGDFIRDSGGPGGLLAGAFLSVIYLIRETVRAIIFGPEYAKATRGDFAKAVNDEMQAEAIRKMAKDQKEPEKEKKEKSTEDPEVDVDEDAKKKAEEKTEEEEEKKDPKKIEKKEDTSIQFDAKKELQEVFGITGKNKDVKQFLQDSGIQNVDMIMQSLSGLDEGTQKSVAVAQVYLVRGLEKMDSITDESQRQEQLSKMGELLFEPFSLGFITSEQIPAIVENAYAIAGNNSDCAKNIMTILESLRDTSEGFGDWDTDEHRDFMDDKPNIKSMCDTLIEAYEPLQNKILLSRGMDISDADALLGDKQQALGNRKAVDYFITNLGLTYDLQRGSDKMQLMSIRNQDVCFAIDKRKMLAGNVTELAKAMKALDCPINGNNSKSKTPPTDVMYITQATALVTLLKQMYEQGQCHSIPQYIGQGDVKPLAFVSNTFDVGDSEQRAQLTFHIDSLDSVDFRLNNKLITNDMDHMLAGGLRLNDEIMEIMSKPEEITDTKIEDAQSLSSVNIMENFLSQKKTSLEPNDGRFTPELTTHQADEMERQILEGDSGRDAPESEEEIGTGEENDNVKKGELNKEEILKGMEYSSGSYESSEEEFDER